MQFMFLCLLGLVLGISGADAQRINVLDTSGFPSSFLSGRDHAESFLNLMKSHFDTSLEFLFASKYYDSQYMQRPGMAKLLGGESDRHWEEGMDVLKKYLQLGGVTHNEAFLDRMVFKGKNALPWINEAAHVKYSTCLKHVMTKSRELVNDFSDLNHEANRKSTGQGDADEGFFGYYSNKSTKETGLPDLTLNLIMAVKRSVLRLFLFEVAHFLQEKAEKESEVSRKMAGHYVTLQKMDSSGIALGIFDKEL